MPAPVPVYTPVAASIVATALLELLHVPEGTDALSADEPPVQPVRPPVMVITRFMVTTAVL